MSRPSASTGTLVIDQGTHATRCVLFDREGTQRACVEEGIALSREGVRVEQDPNQIIGSAQRVLHAACRRAGELGLTLDAAALTTQRSTVVAWDRPTGRPLAPALSWQDTRAESRVAALESKASEIEDRTGLRLSPHYGASKLAWLLENVPEVGDAARRGRLATGPLVAYLISHLVIGNPMLVDHANAARTLLLNLKSRDWDQQLLDLFGIPRGLLPSAQPIRAHYGLLAESRLPLLAVTGDQNAAVQADGELPEHCAFANLGSGAFVLQPTGTRLIRHPPLLSGLIDSTDGQTRYTLEGTVNGAGSALDWARERHQWDIPDGALSDILEQCPDPPVFVNTIGGLGSPWWRPGLRAHWLDRQSEIVPRSGPGLAAVLESIAFMLAENLSLLQAAGQTVERLIIAGGLSRIDGLCQRLADLGHVTVERRHQIEASARGAAWLARGCPENWRVDPGDHFQPRDNEPLEQRRRHFLDGIHRILQT
jgi:glycerol kinase